MFPLFSHLPTPLIATENNVFTTKSISTIVQHLNKRSKIIIYYYEANIEGQYTRSIDNDLNDVKTKFIA